MTGNIRHAIVNEFLRGIGMMRNELRGCETVLDVGCGAWSPLAFIRDEGMHATGVDIHQPSIEESRSKGYHDEYRIMNVMDIGATFGENAFDAVVAFDLVEHLTKENGNALIAQMERIARKRVVVYTPNGFVPSPPAPDNPFQEHISGWEVEEMRAKGYRVYGVNGWKQLRGTYATIRYRPMTLWAGISVITQLWTKDNPESAYHILCVKDM